VANFKHVDHFVVIDIGLRAFTNIPRYRHLLQVPISYLLPNLLHNIVSTIEDVKNKYMPYKAPKWSTRNPMVLNQTICRRYTYSGWSFVPGLPPSFRSFSAATKSLSKISMLFSAQLSPSCQSKNNFLPNSSSCAVASKV